MIGAIPLSSRPAGASSLVPAGVSRCCGLLTIRPAPTGARSKPALGTWASGIRPLTQQERNRSEMPQDKGRGEWILSVVQRQYIQGLLVRVVMCAG